MPVNSSESSKSRGAKRILRWLLKALVLVAVFWLVFVLIGRALRQIAFGQIAELTNTKIEAGSVDFSLNGSVFIEKFVVKPYKKHSYDDAILRAETVYARFGLASLLLLRPQLKEINLNDVLVNAQYDLDTQQWNIPALRLRAPKAGSGKMPLVRIEKGTLQYSKVSNEQVKPIAAVPINAKFGPAGETPRSYSFRITTAKITRGLGESTLVGTWKPGEVTIAGGISSADIPAFEEAWSIFALAAVLGYDQDNNFSLTLRIDDLVNERKPADAPSTFDKPLFLKKSKAFAALQEFFNQYQPAGRFDINLKASGNLKRLRESTIQGRVYCEDVAICSRKFPYLIENLVGPIDFTEDNVLVKDLRGRHKDVELAVNGSFDDFGPNLKSTIRITSRNMALDKDLYNALDPGQKRLWTDFSPSGFAAISYTFSQSPQTAKKYVLSVELLNAEAKYAEFPYPLKNLTGHLLFDHNSIDVRNLVSRLDERRIAISGEVTDANTDEPEYNLLIEVNNIPLDSTLAEALPSPQRNLYNQLQPDGLGDGRINVYMQQQHTGCTTFTANLNFKNAFLKVEKPPVAISDISATAVFTPDFIRIEDFTGRYDKTLISLTGQVWPGTETEQLTYCLSLSAKQAKLDDYLIATLPAAVQSIVAKLQPEGKVNFSAHLNKTDRDDCPDYKVIVECLDNRVGYHLAEASQEGAPVDSKWFPYPLRDITGCLTITKDSITLTDVTATVADNVQLTPDASTIKVNGKIALADDVFTGGLFTVCANDIFFDERLRIALPEDVQLFYKRLSPTGRFSLDFESVRIFNAADGQKYLDLAGVVKFEDCNLDTSPGVADLDAVLKIEGLYKTGSRFSDVRVGFIADGLRIAGIYLTGLRADIHYDRQRRSWLAKNLIVDCYGGRLTGKLEFKQPPDRALEYVLQVGFDNIDLKQFLSDTKRKETSGNSHSTGKMSGSVSVVRQVGKVPPDNYQRIGRFALQITDMQVGKASLLAKLLSILKLTEPKDFAFDRMFVDSYIKDSRVYLEHLDLVGEGLTFGGSGWIDLQNQDVDLTLFVRGSHLATTEPSILGSLTEGLSPAVVRMDVTGNLYDPQVTKTTLSVIKAPLQILGTKPNKAN